MNETRTGLERFQPYATDMHRVTPMCPPCTMDHRCNQAKSCSAKPAPGFYGSGYGDLRPVKPAKPVPCSTLARWWMNFKALL